VPCDSYKDQFKNGDLVQIKEYCKAGGESGIIIKCYYRAEYDLFMSSGKKMHALGSNLTLVSEGSSNT